MSFGGARVPLRLVAAPPQSVQWLGSRLGVSGWHTGEEAGGLEAASYRSLALLLLNRHTKSWWQNSYRHSKIKHLTLIGLLTQHQESAVSSLWGQDRRWPRLSKHCWLHNQGWRPSVGPYHTGLGSAGCSLPPSLICYHTGPGLWW